ncbi:HigA family addiction module antitoxin [Chromobacterium amazonense]|uniref:HigA family addiction module antitoxin n=1 Tax=Chromobacterium amazonense TaxID=1382803 RepID=A0ABU8V1B1_9NEIS|nr:HigA family addiction module antitoxin [Chromobacterium amazonense]MDQ4539058.1 HigA family addiction module antitoxin [Chromobacterium amazonense]
MNARVPAEVFPPGDFLREELEARNWRQQELAEILDRPARLISEIIAGKRAITPETAKGLADAFGTSPDYWMNLESQYQLSKVRSQDKSVARRAFLYERFPVREMIRRGWIVASDSVDILEKQFCEFFSIPSVDIEPTLFHNAKKTNAWDAASPIQIAWLFRAKQLASKQIISAYSQKKLIESLDKLKSLTLSPEEVRHTPRILADAGVHFVIVEPLSGSKIDGACFWLDDKKPVIAMTLRFDRIDNFWFVLRHEIEHILREDGKKGHHVIVDSDVGSSEDGLPEEEVIANNAAAEFCVPSNQLDNFISRVQPYFSEDKVLRFAQRIEVHPGLVVGQLQHRLKRHDFLRKHLVKIRALVLPGSDVDGWGIISE